MKPKAEYTPVELVVFIVSLLILSSGPIAALAIFESELASQFLRGPWTLLERL